MADDEFELFSKFWRRLFAYVLAVMFLFTCFRLIQSGLRNSHDLRQSHERTSSR